MDPHEVVTVVWVGGQRVPVTYGQLWPSVQDLIAKGEVPA
jgi:hypothetical protein